MILAMTVSSDATADNLFERLVQEGLDAIRFNADDSRVRRPANLSTCEWQEDASF